MKKVTRRYERSRSLIVGGIEEGVKMITFIGLILRQLLSAALMAIGALLVVSLVMSFIFWLIDRDMEGR